MNKTTDLTLPYRLNGEKEKKMNGNMFKAEIERVFREARKRN